MSKDLMFAKNRDGVSILALLMLIRNVEMVRYCESFMCI